MHGWPNYLTNKDISLKSYFDRKEELTLESNIVMWGHSIVIPEALQTDILKELYSTHLRITKTKTISLSYFWWYGIDKDIETMILSCDACLKTRPESHKVIKPWPKTSEVFERIHLDFAGPYKDRYFLILVDSYSKWP